MLRVSEIRRRVAAAISGSPGYLRPESDLPDGGDTEPASTAVWRESRQPPKRFVQGSESRPREHLGFAVEVPRTDFRTGDRQRRTLDIHAETLVIVHWSYRLRTTSTDADSALDAEQALVAAILGMDRNPRIEPRLENLTRDTDETGTHVLGEVRLHVSHRYPTT